MSNRFFWDTHFPDIDDGFKRYLEENGDLYDADRSCSTSDRSWGWVRKKKEEEGKTRLTLVNFLTNCVGHRLKR